ncbi:TPA: hypothetical protein ACFRG8_000220 [Neisseria lactamica]
MPSESLICTPKVGLNRQLIKVQVFLRFRGTSKPSFLRRNRSAVIPAQAGI